MTMISLLLPLRDASRLQYKTRSHETHVRLSAFNIRDAKAAPFNLNLPKFERGRLKRSTRWPHPLQNGLSQFEIAMTLSFDEQRDANIARNKALLADLGLDSPNILPSRAKPPPKPRQPKKRKAPTPDASEDSDLDQPAPKAARVVDGDSTGLRRSGRVAGKVVDYAGDGDKLPNNRTPKYVTEAARKGSMVSEAKVASQRTQNPYVSWLVICDG